MVKRGAPKSGALIIFRLQMSTAVPKIVSRLAIKTDKDKLKRSLLDNEEDCD